MTPVLGAIALAGALASAPLPLQAAAEQALGNRAGCVVALDPQDGRLMALVHPKMAVGSAYPIGSLAKLVTALAGVSSGVVDGARVLECRGRGHGRTCWHVHGRIGLEEALAQSCSLYFFRVGLDLGAARLTHAMRTAGFGQSTGSGLAGEVPGLVVPPGTKAELEDLAYGDTSALRATPLQVASFVGALAN
ncbi:MAG TPA: penicillin-binding transpeptidase domain-containing protein, partial [Stenomitos sp.]